MVLKEIFEVRLDTYLNGGVENENTMNTLIVMIYELMKEGVFHTDADLRNRVFTEIISKCPKMFIDMCIFIHNRNIDYTQFILASWIKQEEIIRYINNKNPYLCYLFPNWVTQDIVEILINNGHSECFSKLDVKWHTYDNISRFAIKNPSKAFVCRYMPQCTTRQQWKNLVNKTPTAIEYMPDCEYNDIIESINSFGDNYPVNAIPEHLLNENIISELVKVSPSSIRMIPKEYLTKEIITIGLWADPMCIYYDDDIEEEYLTPEFCDMAWNFNHELFMCLPRGERTTSRAKKTIDILMSKVPPDYNNISYVFPYVDKLDQTMEMILMLEKDCSSKIDTKKIRDDLLTEELLIKLISSHCYVFLNLRPDQRTQQLFEHFLKVTSGYYYKKLPDEMKLSLEDLIKAAHVNHALIDSIPRDLLNEELLNLKLIYKYSRGRKVNKEDAEFQELITNKKHIICQILSICPAFIGEIPREHISTGMINIVMCSEPTEGCLLHIPADMTTADFRTKAVGMFPHTIDYLLPSHRRMLMSVD